MFHCFFMVRDPILRQWPTQPFLAFVNMLTLVNVIFASMLKSKVVLKEKFGISMHSTQQCVREAT